MSDAKIVAIIGLLGLIGGGVISGVVTDFLARRDRGRERQLEARVTAALVFADLESARQAIAAWIRVYGSDIDPHGLRLVDYLQTFETRRESLARGLTPKEFHLVAGVVNGLSLLVRTMQNRPEHVADIPKLDLVNTVQGLDRAAELVWVASGMSADDVHSPLAIAKKLGAPDNG